MAEPSAVSLCHPAPGGDPLPSYQSGRAGLANMDEPLYLRSLADKLACLNASLEDLEKKKKAIEHELKVSREHNVTSVVYERNNAFTPTEMDIIIAFVEEIEKANQYFDLKEFLKSNVLLQHDSDRVEIFKKLVQELKVQEKLEFNKLDYQYIMDAIDRNIVELRIERKREQKLREGNNNVETSLKKVETWYSLMDPKEKHRRALSNPMISLVYYIREKGHIMHEDPKMELDHIKRFNQLFYKRHFIWRLIRKYSEREVMVVFVPPDFEEKDIKDTFACCGEVVSAKFERSGCSKTAYVTFKSSEDAKMAPFLMSSTKFVVEPVPEISEYRSRESIEYMEAIKKYNEFRNYSKKREMETMQT